MFAEPSDREALRFGDRSLTYAELHHAAGTLAERLRDHTRVAVWATSTLETCVAVVAGVLAGVAIVPLNPKLGERELEHILGDSRPDLVLRDEPIVFGEPGTFAEPGPETPALVIYTSGTTGPPKGVVLPRRALTSNIDALSKAWQWTADDVLVHGLPLFHVHGLGIGILGPLRLGGSVRHVKFSPEAIGHELQNGATMMFGVPTMYHRIAEAVENDHALAEQFGKARLLVSGSAALPASDHARIAGATGQGIVERYGMSETLMNVSVRFDGDRRPGAVGLPVDGVDVRVVDEQGHEVEQGAIGEIEVRGPNLFLEYLNRPDATGAAFRDGWFRTGDMAVRDPDGYVRIVGRRATDLIKSGGYKIGAGEIENVLLEHPSVAEVAVTGEPDDDLGERIVAWVVPAGEAPEPSALSDHVAKLLSPHKRPRVVRFLKALPRNEMGKVLKKELS
ncbi:acyl-CoA synthetase [Lentzea sp. NBRC 102530]|uniref:acyl-CoA synthetase n=1 Tax=Lentzea sp. NBRC 102530 TaxID=3032201 RepID=UPI0024A09FF2|nr:acyl-CoA synthetase [Lentzea sp. NBRC 102530]GLY52293.1 fatty-acyl-CoA synthase [Lentzea sp. NBRC 102530]